mmetsp:Transcript_17583/g.53157  ORF Transcript_17583/g.53157 Transcript_17583/m.53157 type:complete len:86 (+) Transcript_17583:247-504(+)
MHGCGLKDPRRPTRNEEEVPSLPGTVVEYSLYSTSRPSLSLIFAPSSLSAWPAPHYALQAVHLWPISAHCSVHRHVSRSRHATDK